MLKFPKNFLWGAATASYQVEGGIENNDWAEAARQGRVPPCGRACDHYHLYEQDFDLAKELGHNAHRFSIEWARIEPEEGKFDEEAIEHYRKVLRALRARNLEPFITLWHFTLPQWFAASGGFERRDSSKLFARYCTYVTEHLGDLCSHFATMNESHVWISNGYRRGTWPPFYKWPGIDGVLKIAVNDGVRDAKPIVSIKNLFLYWWVFHKVAFAHNAAYKAIKKVKPDVSVEVVKQVILFHHNGSLWNQFRAWLGNLHWTHYWFWLTKNSLDAVDLNYYIHKKFGDTATYEKSDIGWDIYPEGIYDALMMLKRYRKKVYVSESGIADAEDKYRAEYITKQAKAVWQAIGDGVDVRGYMYWSLLDNYEWAEGFSKRFGLIEIDYDTLERKVRSSAYVYKKIIEQNGLVE